MPQFRSLKELQAYLEANVAEVMENHANIIRYLADKISENVKREVYDAYTPEEYKRRGDKDFGLADVRNMEITDVHINGDKVVMVVENLAKGSDSMEGHYISDMIEYGIKDLWENPNGPWSEPRPFMKATADDIRNSPSELIAAIKGGLKAKGFRVR